MQLWPPQSLCLRRQDSAETIQENKKGGVVMAAIYWLIAFVVLVGIEIMTTALTTIWFAGGAVIALSLIHI